MFWKKKFTWNNVTPKNDVWCDGWCLGWLWKNILVVDTVGSAGWLQGWAVKHKRGSRFVLILTKQAVRKQKHRPSCDKITPAASYAWPWLLSNYWIITTVDGLLFSVFSLPHNWLCSWLPLPEPSSARSLPTVTEYTEHRLIIGDLPQILRQLLLLLRSTTQMKLNHMHTCTAVLNFLCHEPTEIHGKMSL